MIVSRIEWELFYIISFSNTSRISFWYCAQIGFALHYPIFGTIFALKEKVYPSVIISALDVMSIFTMGLKSSQPNS